MARQSRCRKAGGDPEITNSVIDTEVIYCDDNLERLTMLPSGSADLIYLDPPFFSNRDYEVIWGDEAEVRSFSDRWDGGIEHYIEWMKERCLEMHRVLAETGSLYLHCDPTASHYLKVMLDKIFDRRNFRNEIIWSYRRWPSKSKKFQTMHDVILFYTASDNNTFHVSYEPPSESYLKRFKGKTQVLDEETKTRKIVVDKPTKGMPQRDVWDISIIAGSAKERIGYPTQKPIALLKRIINASSNLGDVVLDPFCGCGTARAAAEELGRRWVGIDISATAARVTKNRMWQNRLWPDTAKIVGMPATLDDLERLEPFEFENWVIGSVYGTHSSRKTADMGIDGYSFFERLPIQVKQMDRVGRPVIDSFQTAVRRTGKHKGYVIAFGFSRDAHEEATRAKRDGLLIELVKVSTILDNPLDFPPRPELPELTRELFEEARRARRKRELRARDSLPTAEQLFASATC